MNLKSVLLATALVAIPVSALRAQTSAPPADTTHKERHSIPARQARQQARINHGVADGQITPGGAARADRNQARIANQETRMRNADGGRLTPADRQRLATEQNRANNGIYNRNHNAATDPGVTPQPVSPSRVQ